MAVQNHNSPECDDSDVWGGGVIPKRWLVFNSQDKILLQNRISISYSTYNNPIEIFNTLSSYFNDLIIEPPSISIMSYKVLNSKHRSAFLHYSFDFLKKSRLQD